MASVKVIKRIHQEMGVAAKLLFGFLSVPSVPTRQIPTRLKLRSAQRAGFSARTMRLRGHPRNAKTIGVLLHCRLPGIDLRGPFLVPYFQRGLEQFLIGRPDLFPRLFESVRSKLCGLGQLIMQVRY